MNCSMPGLPVHHQLPEFTQTHVHPVSMPSSHLILCRPLLLLPPIPPRIRGFSNESTLRMRWPKYWSFSFSIIPCKEIPGLIFFRMDWLDLLAVQGTLKSLLQHHSSKASTLWHSAFFPVQLLDPYMTTGKTIALTRWTFVGKDYEIGIFYSLKVQLDGNMIWDWSFLLWKRFCKLLWDFLGPPVVKTLSFQGKGCGFSAWSGNKDPTCCAPKIKQSLL